MSHQVKVGKNRQIPLPEKFRRDLKIEIGDILICEITEGSSKVTMKKHVNQSLTDIEIASAGNLTRVIPYTTDLY